MILDTKAKAALSYALGLISGLIMLSVEKHDPYVRFHALQSVLVFTVVGLVSLLLPTVPVVGSWPLVRFVFLVGVVGLWITLIVKAVRGEAYRLPYVGDVAATYSVPSGK
jgi:uncharacterized membrane protein